MDNIEIIKNYDSWSKDKKKHIFKSRIITASVLDSHSWGFQDLRSKCMRVLKKENKIISIGGQKYSLN